MSFSRPAFSSSIALAVSIPMLAWVAVYVFNDWVFARLQWSAGINWVFLPAAVRLLSVLVFGPLGALGLFIGGLVTMTVVESAPLGKALAVAAASATAPLVAVTVLLHCLRMQPTLLGIGSAQLLALAVGNAATSVAMHNFYYWISAHRADPLSGMVPMFVGDLVGTLIVFYTLRSILRVHARLCLARRS